ncbi:MAG: ATP-binding protein [Planctomycetota bacterium]|nr:ATP-binding protein [Planctomycetota bacterium]
MLLILVGSGVSYIRDAQEQEVQKRAATSVRLLCSTFQESVLGRAFGDVAAIAQSALEDTEMLYIRVTRPNGRVVALAEAEGFSLVGAPTPDRVLDDSAEDGVFEATGDITVAGEVFARVDIGLDTSRTFGVVRAARLQALKIVGLEMALVALFSFILGSLLTRSLRALEVAVDTVASGDFHARVPVVRDDELGRVATRFNSMAERLETVRDRQAQTVQLLGALSRAQQLHLLGRSDHEVSAALLETVSAITGSEAACLQREGACHCAVCVALGADSVEAGDRDGLTWTSAPGRDGAWVTRIPLLQGEQFFGALNLLRKGAGHSTGEVAVVLALAPQIAALIEALDERTAQARKDQLQRAILGNVIDGIVSADQQGVVMNANPAFERMFGLDPQGAVGTRLKDWIELTPWAEHKGEARKRECRATRANGTPFDVEVARAQVGADGDREAFALWVVGEITVRKRVEAETQKAMQAAREAQRAKSAFLANMSHELRTPMNGVLGMLQLLQVDALEPNQIGNVETAVAAAEHLLEILDDVLVFSKAEAGKMALESVPFDLSKQVEESARLLAHSAFAKGVELTCEIPNMGEMVLGDPTRLKQVLVNLLGNAVKFTEHGSVAVRLSVTGSTEARHSFRIEVEDTGVGIPAAALPELFSPFQQADSSTTRRYGGTGLGLSICRELMSLMGGTLEVETGEGAGATFTAELDLGRTTRASEPAAYDLAGTEFVIRGDLHRTAAVTRAYLEGMGATEVPSPRSAPGAVIFVVSRGTSVRGTLNTLGDYPNRYVVLTEPGWVCDEKAPPHATMLTAPATRAELALAMQATVRRRDTGLQLVGFEGEVLLVEDNHVNQRVMEAMLHRLGVKCSVVGNGALAVERLRTESFRLVLMDCQMPVMDGFEATRVLRERGFRAPIIAVTANVLSETRDACQRAGMNGFLSKPIKIADLQGILERFLQPEEADDEDEGEGKVAT